MPTPNQYWYFLIGGPTNELSGTVANFYAYGQHCGEALDNALQAATEKLGILNPEATEAARLDILDNFEKPEDLINLTDLVLTRPQNYSYPLDSYDKDFITPTGIIKSTEDGEFEYELVKTDLLELLLTGYQAIASNK